MTLYEVSILVMTIGVGTILGSLFGLKLDSELSARFIVAGAVVTSAGLVLGAFS